MISLDPEVGDCLRKHAHRTDVERCADCGICEDCDCTLTPDESSGKPVCEICALARDAAALEQLLTWPHGRAMPTSDGGTWTPTTEPTKENPS